MGRRLEVEAGELDLDRRLELVGLFARPDYDHDVLSILKKRRPSR